MIQASLIISLQNNVLINDLMLASIERQLFRDFEVIIVADHATSDVIRTVQTRLPLLNVPARVVWSADSGFTPSREQQLISTAIRNAESTYCIFVDSSIILHREFIREHLLQSTEGYILTGQSVELSESIVSELTADEVRNGWLEYKYWRILADGVFGCSTHVMRGLYLHSNLMRKLVFIQVNDVYSQHFSLNVADAEQLLFASEQSRDITMKNLLHDNNLQVIDITNAAVSYHCNENKQPTLQFSQGVLQRVKRIRYKVPELGFQPVMVEAKRVKNKKRF